MSIVTPSSPGIRTLSYVNHSEDVIINRRSPGFPKLAVYTDNFTDLTFNFLTQFQTFREILGYSKVHACSLGLISPTGE